MDFIDPFGAPEHFIDNFSYVEIVPHTGLVRVAYCARDGRENIVKVKLLWPLPVLRGARMQTEQFFAHEPGRQRILLM